MPFDRAAHRTQAARIVAHTAGAEVVLRFLGKGVEFPAAIAADRPKPADVNRDLGAQQLEIVSIARAVCAVATTTLVFTGKLPREGDHFTGLGRQFRIQEDRTLSGGPLLVYACTASALAP